MKRVPLKRKVSLRDGFLRKLKQNGTKVVYGRNGSIKRRKPLKKISRSQRTKLAHYYAVHAEFLSRPESADCQICVRRRESGENIPLHAATEVHHYAGRAGRLISYVPYFMASCFSCRQFPHEQPKRAREIGVMAPAALWNVFPESDQGEDR